MSDPTDVLQGTLDLMTMRTATGPRRSPPTRDSAGGEEKVLPQSLIRKTSSPAKAALRSASARIAVVFARGYVSSVERARRTGRVVQFSSNSPFT